jgi:hypothetical protein
MVSLPNHLVELLPSKHPGPSAEHEKRRPEAKPAQLSSIRDTDE